VCWLVRRANLRITAKKRSDIHYNKVKSEYHKTLAREKERLQTPEYLRRILDEEAERVAKEQSAEAASSPSPSAKKSTAAAPARMDRFHKERTIYEQNKAQRDAELATIKAEEEQEKKARKAYFDERRKTNAKLMKKTTRGQPKLNNQIDHILAKLQKEKK